MSKSLYLECGSGISGDMTVAALLDLGADREVLEKSLESLKLPGYEIAITRVKKSGLDACDFNVILDAEHENHDHDMAYLHGDGAEVHDHPHDHEHHHDHEHAHSHDHDSHSLLFIENVGNLVCPAVWDLGEAAKVAILSVTEGEDKPLKYPDMFAASQLMILNKIDLLPHVKFDVARCIELARRVNPAIEIIQLSATTGEGMGDWLHWLDHALGHGHHHPAESGAEAALRQRVQQLEAELAQARAALAANPASASGAAH